MLFSSKNPSSFGSIRLMVWEDMSFAEFQDGRHGGHLGYQNRMILAILNLYITLMPPTMFQLNLTYGLGGNVVWRISRYSRHLVPEQNNFSHSESPCCHNPPTKFQLNPTYGSGGVQKCQKCEKLMTDGQQTTDNRPWHKLTLTRS